MSGGAVTSSCVPFCRQIDEMKKDLEEQKDDIEWRRTHFYPDYEKELLARYLKYKGNIRIFVRVRPILSNDFLAYEGTRESFNDIEKKIKLPN